MSNSKFGKISFFKISISQIEMESSIFKEFLSEIEDSLNIKRSKLNDQIIETRKENPEYAEVLEEELWKLDEPFKEHAYNSQLISCYSFMESWLFKLCEFHYRLGFNSIKVNDLKGQNYIEKSRLYLLKLGGILLDDLQNEWNRIREIQQIRNLIAHNGSNIIKREDKPITDQPQYQIIKREQNIELNESNGSFYICDKSFLIDVIEIFEKYLKTIALKLDEPKVVIKSSELPYDMGTWGREKVQALIKQTIHGAWLIDNCEKRKDEYRINDTMANSKSIYNSMNWNLTKLLSLFSGATWDVTHSGIINEKGKAGLKEIKKLYNIRSLEEE